MYNKCIDIIQCMYYNIGILKKGVDELSKGKLLNITLQEEIYNRLKEVSDKKSLSMAALIRLALSEYLEKN